MCVFHDNGYVGFGRRHFDYFYVFTSDQVTHLWAITYAEMVFDELSLIFRFFKILWVMF